MFWILAQWQAYNKDQKGSSVRFAADSWAFYEMLQLSSSCWDILLPRSESLPLTPRYEDFYPAGRGMHLHGAFLSYSVLSPA